MADKQTHSSLHDKLPRTLAGRMSRPLVRFLHMEAASGGLLLVCTATALALAHSQWAESFAAIWHTEVGFSIGGYTLRKPFIELVINDGLMTIFFFVVGLEIKREMVLGELRDPRKAALPMMGALGGMLVPAAIYFMFQHGQPGESGWGIPMATDIAFVVGFLAILGSRVPFGLKIFMLTLAIADDIGAILVIALFYSSGVQLLALAAAAAGFVLIVLLSLVGVRRVGVYVVVGAMIWFAFLKSGVHPTVAGVLLGLFTPASAWVGDQTLRDVLASTLSRLEGAAPTRRDLQPLLIATEEAVSPLQRLEVGLHPWVAYIIMPLFALANAGVAIETSRLTDPIALAVSAGLILGKPIGIVLLSWIAVRIGLAKLPSGVTWKMMIVGGCLGGIGFTMSLFITNLALPQALQEAGKVGTLIGSLVSAVLGCALALILMPPKRTADAAD